MNNSVLVAQINSMGEFTPMVADKVDERILRHIESAISDLDLGDTEDPSNQAQVVRGWDGYYIVGQNETLRVYPKTLDFFETVNALHPSEATDLNSSVTEVVVPTHRRVFTTYPMFEDTPIEGAPENPVFRLLSNGTWENVPGRVLWDGTIVDKVTDFSEVILIIPKDGEVVAPIDELEYAEGSDGFGKPIAPLAVTGAGIMEGGHSIYLSDGTGAVIPGPKPQYVETSSPTDVSNVKFMNWSPTLGALARTYDNQNSVFEWVCIKADGINSKWVVSSADSGWIDSTVWSKILDPSLPSGFKSRTRYSAHGMDHRVTYPGPITGLPKSFPIPPWVFNTSGLPSTGTDWTQDVAGVDIRLRPVDGSGNPITTPLHSTVKIDTSHALAKFSDPSGQVTSIGSMTAGAYAPFVENWPSEDYFGQLLTGPTVSNEL